MPNLTVQDFPFKNETYAINGAAMEVHKELGCGFLEGVYQEALQIELKLRDIPFIAQHPLKIKYKGQTLIKSYIPDFLCFDSIIVELKALSELNSEHEAQVFNYLKATNKKVGLLINFGKPSLQFKRIVNTHYF
ncbi:GxxExxY protein [Alkalitalea saponilacus]|nr:GxxExxY protein [Alkalitalea saponilacus]